MIEVERESLERDTLVCLVRIEYLLIDETVGIYSVGDSQTGNIDWMGLLGING